MAAALLLGSLARKMARASPTRFQVLPSPSIKQQGRGDQFVVGVPAAAGLRSLATKVSRAPPHHRLVHAQRGLHSLNSTPSASKMDFAKIRAGVAYVALFGSLAYLYGSLLPRLKKLEGKLEAQKQSKLDDALATDASTNGQAQIMQSSAARAGDGKQPAGETKYETKYYKDLEDKITKIELLLEAARKKRHD